MTDKVEKILWCHDCMLKHSRDLLHHAEARGNSELRRMAQKAFDISSKMLKVKDKGLYSDIRDMEHHAEDLLTGLRTERKRLTKGGCPSCEEAGERIRRFSDGTKDLNRGGDQELNTEFDKGGNMKAETKLVGNAMVGNLVGKGVSVATPMVIPGATMGIANKTLVNVGAGILLSGLALYGKLKKADIILAVAGTNMIANEVVDLAMGYVTPAPAPAAIVAASNAQMNYAANAQSTLERYPYGTVGGTGAKSATYSNGSLVYVD